MTNKKLGTLNKIELRDIWITEDKHFTPWLAEEKNLALLSNTIGIELDLEAQEKNVGPFRADILCKDTTSGNWVLIENQLEKTDHTHLGQLMTYASGLKAVTIVWVAKRFTEEHRAALDWLNGITEDKFNFFGLEVELWQIGDSPIAPKFNIISKPNDWSRSVSGAAEKISQGALSPTKQLQLEYWTALKEYLIENDSFLKPQKPSPHHWTNISIGRTDFWMNGLIKTRDNKISCKLNLSGNNSKIHFNMLYQEKEKIEQEFGTQLDWRERPDGVKSQVLFELNNFDLTNKSSWSNAHQWFKTNLEKMHTVFSNRIKNLNADEYMSESED